MSSAFGRLRLLIVPLTWLLSLACVAAVAATLFWRFAAPAPVDLPLEHDSDPRAAAQRIAGQHPFADRAVPVVAVAQPVSSSRFSIVGLATGFVDGPGFAMISSGNQAPEAFAVGDEVASGVRLKRILPDGVELDRGGRIERIALPSASTAGITPVDSSNTPQPPAPR